MFKDQSVGIGSYGAICKAKCDDLLCAAKSSTQLSLIRLHSIKLHLRECTDCQSEDFEQECKLKSAIRHQNTVQYLSMFGDADTRLLVLLMELMDDSLTHFLEQSPQVHHQFF